MLSAKAAATATASSVIATALGFTAHFIIAFGAV